MVSICCITYNHAAFIGHCLDGFLMQETTFPVEILVHDDASSDGAADIIREYEGRYAELVKPICQSENQHSKGIGGNSAFNIPRARGRYIALCEGDDYWTDPGKLERQVAFLDVNPDYVLVAENSIFLNLQTGESRPFSTLPERDLDIPEMLRERQFATGSVLFRNLGPALKHGAENADIIRWCHLRKLGRIRYRTDISSVYRRHSGGVTGGDKVALAKKMIAWNKVLSEQHPEVPTQVFFERNFYNFNYAISVLLREGRYREALSVLDELSNATSTPDEYRRALYASVDGMLRERDGRAAKLMADLRGSVAYRVGRAITWPARNAMRLKAAVAGIPWKRPARLNRTTQ